MATITTTIYGDMQALSVVSANQQGISTVVNVAGALAAWIIIRHAPLLITAPTKGTEYPIEVSHKSSGNDAWIPLPGGGIVTGITAATSFAANAAIDAGTQLVLQNPTTGLAVDGRIFVYNANSIGLSEWGKIAAIAANSSFTLVDSLTYAIASGGQMFDEAEVFGAALDLSPGFQRIRARCNNNYQAGTAVPVAWDVALNLALSIG